MPSVFRSRLLSLWGSLHIGEAIRRRALRRTVRRHISPGAHVLDAGCGRGDNALWFAQQYPNVTVDAVDIDPKLVERVERRINVRRLRNIDVTVGDVERFSSTPSRSPSQREGEKRMYATIYSVDVFEHLKDPARAITNLAAALAPGGALLIHVPRATQRRFFRRFEHYEQHDHERDGFEPEELAGLMRAAGLDVETIQHTFGPPGALAWELFHLAQGIGKWLALLTYPIPWLLARIDGMCTWKRGNGMLVIARNVKGQSSNVK